MRGTVMKRSFPRELLHVGSENDASLAFLGLLRGKAGGQRCEIGRLEKRTPARCRGYGVRVGFSHGIVCTPFWRARKTRFGTTFDARAGPDGGRAATNACPRLRVHKNALKKHQSGPTDFGKCKNGRL